MALKFSFHVAVDRLCIEAQPLTTVSDEKFPRFKKSYDSKNRQLNFPLSSPDIAAWLRGALPSRVHKLTLL
jgi:hypothetical protein